MQLKKCLLTQFTMQQSESLWLKEYPSIVYQSALQALKDGLFRWRQGLSEFSQQQSKERGDIATDERQLGRS